MRIPEPKPRRDRRCVVCEKPITTVTRYGDADAFCSSRCARSFFGTSLAVDEDVKRSALANRIQEEKTEAFAR